MDDHVANVGPRGVDTLLDLAGAGVRGRQRSGGIEPECEEDHEALVGREKAELPRRTACSLLDDARDGGGRGGDVRPGRACAAALLGKRLQMGLDRLDVAQRLGDRTLDRARDRVRILERQLARKLDVERDLLTTANLE